MNSHCNRGCPPEISISPWQLFPVGSSFYNCTKCTIDLSHTIRRLFPFCSMRYLGVLQVLPHPLWDTMEAYLSGCSYNMPAALYVPGGGMDEGMREALWELDVLFLEEYNTLTSLGLRLDHSIRTPVHMSTISSSKHPNNVNHTTITARTTTYWKWQFGIVRFGCSNMNPTPDFKILSSNPLAFHSNTGFIST